MQYLKYIILLIIILMSCSEQPKPKNNNINIITSIAPLAEFTEKIGGTKVNVSTMIPPGASPHTYAPRPNQLIELTKAHIYIKVGTPIEFELVWLKKLLTMNTQILIIDASKDIDLIESNHIHDHKHEHNHAPKHSDPHIWLSPLNAKIIVENIYQGLSSNDSKNKIYYQTRKNKYLKKLDDLYKSIKQDLKNIENNKFMTYHPSWGYFARDFNLEQISVEEKGSEPTAKGIQNLIIQAQKNNITYIIASPQFNTNSAELIVREIKGHVILISPMEKNYISNLLKLSEVISNKHK